MEPLCGSCGTALRATDKFCCWCGEPQPMRVLPYEKTCIHCRVALPDRAIFCYLCGEELHTGAKERVKGPVELFTDDSEYFPRFEA